MSIAQATTSTHQLVVQSHATRAQASSASPRAEESIRPTVLVLTVLVHSRDGTGERDYTLLSERGDDRVGVDGPESFDSMSDGIERRGDL